MVAFFAERLYNDSMKKFRYSFPRPTLILIIAGLAVCLAGFIVNLYVCITQGTSHAVDPALPLTGYILTFLITIVAGGMLAGVLCRSGYIIKGDKLISAFGLIASSYAAADIEIIVLDRQTEKLTVGFKDEGKLNVLIKKESYADFVQAILDINPAIEYAIQSIENTPDDKNKKN